MNGGASGCVATVRDGCWLIEPKMAGWRCRRGAHGPFRPGPPFSPRLPFWDGAAATGRDLAMGSRSGRGLLVPWDGWGRGERMGPKESSEKTYRIFLQGVSGLRPLTPPSDGWAALRIAALEMSETLGPTRRYRELFKMQRTVESPCMKLPFLATGAKRGVWGSQGTRACQVVFRGAEAVGDRIS